MQGNRLLAMAKDQAALSNVAFENVEGEMEIMASYAGSLMASPPVKGNGPGYSEAISPASVYDASVYFFAPGAQVNTTSDEFQALHGMDTIFIPLMASDSHLTSVYAASESGITRLYPWTSGIDPSFDARNRSWYTTAADTGTTTWSAPYIDVSGHGLLITASRSVKDASHGWYWVIGSDVTIETINQQIINTQVGKSGYAMLLDQHGNIIARPGATAGSQQWDETFQTENLFDSTNPGLRTIAGRMTAGETGVEQVSFEGRDKYVAFAPVRTTNWSIAVVMPVDEIIAPAKETRDKNRDGDGGCPIAYSGPGQQDETVVPCTFYPPVFPDSRPYSCLRQGNNRPPPCTLERIGRDWPRKP